MGRRNKLNKTKTTRKFNSGKAVSTKTPVYFTEELLEKAQEYIDSFQYELAEQFCSRAREQTPDNVDAQEISGILMLEMGKFEEAKTMFSKAIELSPDKGHEKYMYMGQIYTGSEAVQYFLRGIELMKNHIVDMAAQAEAIAGPDQAQITPMNVSSAYCSVAEIYLTDECFDAEAEIRCQECLDNAIKECNENAEAYHLYASFWLSKNESEKALEAMKKGVALWLPKWSEASCDSGAADKFDEDEMSLCSLSYPARLNATKLLIELEQYETAGEILELLLDEDDEVVETWYLLGWVNHLQGEDYKNNARYYLGKAQLVAKKTDCVDEELLVHVNKLLEELGGPVDDLPTKDEEEDDMDEEGEASDDQETNNPTGQEEMNL